jgi:hypothetical protein
MTNDLQQQEIQRRVLERIQSGKARMHTHAYFVARIIATVAVAVISLALSSLIMSFILFSIHESGEQFLLGFGTQGVSAFFNLFPWSLFVIDIAILILLQWLLRGFRFGYRLSLLTVFLTVCVMSSLIAFAFNLTPVHGSLLDDADRGELPIVGDLYENIRDSHEDQGIFRGTVTSITGNIITIEHNDGDHDEDDGIRTVVLPNSAFTFSVGDRVYIFGSSTPDGIHAYGVVKLSPDQ